MARMAAQKDVDGYRLLYVLNHLCPSLYHFHRQPDPKRFMGDMDGYNAAAQKHFLENTQAGLLDSDGTLIQEGVCYDAESFNAFPRSSKVLLRQVFGAALA